MTPIDLLARLAAVVAAAAPAPAIDPDALEKVRERAAETASSAVFIEVKGQAVLDDHDPDSAERELVHIQSITKSIVGLAVGVLIGDGRIAGLDEPVARHLPGFTGDARGRVTIRHVLAHRTGIAAGDDFGLAVEQSPDYLAFALRADFDAEPGFKTAYNNAAIQLAGGVVEAASGLPLDRFVAERILKPLGIERYAWIADPAGRPAAHAGLSLTAPDLAKIGRLVLQRGAWEGRQIIPSSFFDDATPAAADEAAPLGWNIVGADASAARIDEDALRAAEAAGADPELIAKARAVPPGSVVTFLSAYANALTPEERVVLRAAVQAAGHRSAVATRWVSEAFYTTGGGGQCLVIEPSTGLVGVRLIAADRVVDESTAFRDFLPSALGVTPEPAP